MADVSPRLNSPDQSSERAPQDISDILRTASALKEAVETLASSFVNGSGIERAEARNHFEIALADFSVAIDQTAE